MNNDLISREALKEEIKEQRKSKVYSEADERQNVIIDCILYIIDNADSADEPQGEWIEGENGNIKCDKCGCEIRYSYLIGNKSDFPKFCCDCGAKMKGAA